MTRCHACGGSDLTRVLDLGPIPVAHRFRETAETAGELRHPMVLHACEGCGLLQILDPLPPEALYRDYNFCFSAWKPQPHMHDEARIIEEHVGLGGRVLEVGSNDGAFLHVLRERGFTDLAGVEPNPLACERARETGAAIFEGFFGEDLAGSIREERGPADLIVSRQTVEHIADLPGFLRGLERALTPEGWFLIEVPDFEVALQHGDPSSLWEEHVNYFGGDVLQDWLEGAGYEVARLDRYPFCGGALMALARRLERSAERSGSRDLTAWRRKAAEYEQKIAALKGRLVACLERQRAAGLANLLYGTGCRANSIVNGLELDAWFDVVVDDQPEKQGLYMPGSARQVQPSSALYEHVGACYLSVNHENEAKVMARHAEFERKGGRFFSLNSPSPLLERLA